MGKKILYLQYANPACYPPLEHSSRIFSRCGCEILFLGINSLGESGNIIFKYDPKIKIKKMVHCPHGWRQKLHYIFFCLWCIFEILRYSPKWIYASDPLSAPLALLFRHISSIGIIYHEHDSPAGGEKSPLSKFYLWARKSLIRKANIRIFPNTKRVSSIIRKEEKSGINICFYNCPSREEIGPKRDKHEGKSLHLYYHGSIGADRLPLAIIQAMSLLPGCVDLQIFGYDATDYSQYTQTLIEKARKEKVIRRIHFGGTVSIRYDLMNRCRLADIGLALLPKKAHDINNKYMAGASNKPFDYLACGLALLVSDLPEWQEMYVKPGYGLACEPDDPVSIATAIKWFLDHPDEMRDMGERGRQRIAAEWNYENQFNLVLKTIL